MKNENLRAITSIAIFIICLCLTLPFVTGLCSFTSIKDAFSSSETEGTEENIGTLEPSEPADSGTETADSTSPESEAKTEPMTPSTDETTVSPEISSNPETDIQTDPETQSPDTTEVPETEEITTDAPETEALNASNYPWTNLDISYFEGALFIGDSNVNGLRLYSSGELGQAAFFAKDGMMCREVLDENTNIPVYLSGKSTPIYTGNFEGLLKSGSYTKFYIMFGANESGYANLSFVRDEIAKIMEKIREYCPDAVFYLEGTLLGTKKWSDGFKYDRNGNILKINSYVSELADWKTTVYIDLNDIFSDGNGNCDTQYSNGYHLSNRSHYLTWCRWIMTKGMIKSE